jgi:hypothetical protein
MKAPFRSPLIATLLTGILAATPALADHHLMQVEQVIGGVEGDVTAQAVQLRMRGGGQNIMSHGRLRAWDAAGANPVMVIDFTTNVPLSGAGVRVLVLSAGMVPKLNGTSNADYTMTNPIPASYLAAGSLTFEDDFGTVWWRVSWGGAAYTGTGAVNGTNDAQLDGTFNPPFAGPCPTTTTQAMNVTLAATAGGRSTLQDYLLTEGAAVLTNNAGVARTLTSVASVEPLPGSGIQLGAPSPNPSRGALSYVVSLEHPAHVRLDVFSAGGRLLRTLENREMSAGIHRMGLDPRGPGGAPLGSGVYYLRLTAGGVKQTRAFSFVR